MADEASDPGDLSPGFELPGGYTIDDPVVQGRTRLIYAARTAEGELVAVHVLDAGLVDGLGEWFTQGATSRAQFIHPTLLKSRAVGRLEDGRPFEVTDFLEGTSMREALASSPDGIDPLAVVHVVNEVAAALDALHAMTPPVVHRTLCPEHLVVLRDTHEVRLLGLHYADRPQFEGVRPGYRSPEELAGVLSLGPRADVFSLATVTYELLTGRPAWPHVPELALDSMRVGVRDRVSVLRPSLPTALDAVFERAWSLSPDARHSSAGRFARAVRAAIDPLDLAASMASNVFDDRPTAQVPTLAMRVRNNTLLNAGAVAQAIVPRAVSGTVRASESEEPDRPATAPARLLRAPVAPGTRPVRAGDSEPPPKIALPRPEELLAAVETEPPPVIDETPVATASPVPEPTVPTDVVAIVGSARSETTQPTVLPDDARPTPAASEPPDEPTPLATDARPVTPLAAPLPRPVAPILHDPVIAPPPAPESAPPERRPDAYDPRLFRDEPTTIIQTVRPEAPAGVRSPVALAGLFIAHAILIVGLAHAISYALVQRQSPGIQLVPGPSPVCAPCAACPAAVATPVPAVAVPIAAPPAVTRGARPTPPRPVARPQIIRSLPDFGRPR